VAAVQRVVKCVGSAAQPHDGMAYVVSDLCLQQEVADGSNVGQDSSKAGAGEWGR
jgi:hypothetical protein